MSIEPGPPPLLDVRGVTLQYRTRDHSITATYRVDFQIHRSDRFVLLGLSARLRMLVVCHCYRQADDVIRLISARRANSFERQQYEDRRTR